MLGRYVYVYDGSPTPRSLRTVEEPPHSRALRALSPRPEPVRRATQHQRHSDSPAAELLSGLTAVPYPHRGPKHLSWPPVVPSGWTNNVKDQKCFCEQGGGGIISFSSLDFKQSGPRPVQLVVSSPAEWKVVARRTSKDTQHLFKVALLS
ncbi:hypothetical protein VTJ83DRAFT_240 [Remersonia thermophila]|uniref:Uncharacterized protein n=1 Tax=Remersonia thermophila TaxID=72144 RepID=A0ABR4DMW7_9PEZI